MKLEPVRNRWERRTSELNADIMRDVAREPGELERLKRRRAYAVARVARLTADIMPRLDGCGVEGLPIACKCGLVGAKKTCRQWWLCGSCRARRSPSLGADIRKGLTFAMERAVEEWGRNGGKGTRPMLLLLTLTQRHSGDLSRDQAALADGWRRLYKRLNEDDGRFPYVGVWEVTKGRDGLGHVHLHLAVIWRYRDWKRVRAQWETACPTSQHLSIVKGRRDGKPSTPASVGNYLGKYLSKGVDTERFTPYLRAEVSAAFYNQRSVVTSQHFWRRQPKCCRVCKERFVLVEVQPEPFLARIADGVLNLYFHNTEPIANAPTNAAPNVR